MCVRNFGFWILDFGLKFTLVRALKPNDLGMLGFLRWETLRERGSTQPTLQL
jgi:hypothetical protein